MSKTFVRSAVIALAVLTGSAIPADAQELSWAEKMFDRQKIDFGVIAKGSDARLRVKFTNLYKQDVHIADVRTTCGCSAAEPSKTTLKSRESAYLDVTMNTRRFDRRKDSNVIVTFDAPQYREVRIPITAYIRTDVVLTPGSAGFGAVEHGKEAVRTIKIAYAGRNTWTIREVKSQNKLIEAKAVETSRGNGRVNYDLIVALKPGVPVGTLRESITLITDDSNSPRIPILVEARVEADITVTPSLIALGQLTPGQRKTVNVVLRGKKPFKVEKIECKSNNRSFKVRLPKTAKAVHVLPLTITTPTKAGNFNEEFTVKIAGRPEPVTFKAYGKVVETKRR